MCVIFLDLPSETYWPQQDIFADLVGLQDLDLVPIWRNQKLTQDFILISVVLVVLLYICIPMLGFVNSIQTVMWETRLASCSKRLMFWWEKKKSQHFLFSFQRQLWTSKTTALNQLIGLDCWLRWGRLGLNSWFKATEMDPIVFPFCAWVKSLSVVNGLERVYSFSGFTRRPRFDSCIRWATTLLAPWNRIEFLLSAGELLLETNCFKQTANLFKVCWEKKPPTLYICDPSECWADLENNKQQQKESVRHNFFLFFPLTFSCLT